MLSVLEAQQRAWNAGSIEDFMAAGYWESDALTFLSGGDWTRGYDTVLGRYRRRYLDEGGEMGRLRFSDVEALRLARDVGLVRGHWTLTFSGSSDPVSGLFTLVMEHHPEGWRIVHDHTSVAGEPRSEP